MANILNRSNISAAGFTLVELMVTLLIASVVMAYAVPAFDGLIERSRYTSEFNRLLGDIAFARSEAVKRSTPVSLCPTKDGITCDDTAEWYEGWLLFVDDGGTAPVLVGPGINVGNRNLEAGVNEELLRVGSRAKGSVKIGLFNFVDNGDDGILFTADGKLESGVAASIGEIVFCDDSGLNFAKGITFSPFGQFRQMRDTDSDGVIDYGAGQTPVVCPT